MEPQIYGVLGAAMALGLAGGKLIDNLWACYGTNRGSGNGKLEILLKRLVKLAEQERALGTDLMTALALMQQEMRSHEARESKAWEDMLRIVRQVRNGY